jgi:hypothetical protein
MVRTGNVPDSTLPSASSAAPEASPASAAADLDTVTAAIKDNATGTLFNNPTVNDASFSDIFEGNEVGNAAHVDLGKVQMFFFTIVVAIAYIVALWDVVSAGGIYGANFSFPELSDGMVALLGISNASYLASKGVNHT